MHIDAKRAGMRAKRRRGMRIMRDEVDGSKEKERGASAAA